MSDPRLIERWLPIAELGEESARERRSMTALPPTYYLHVWWARRPLVASRAAVLASVLPEDADRERFLHVLGIHGDPVEARSKIDNARRTGIRVKDPYGYDRAFKYVPAPADVEWFESYRSATSDGPVVLDPTAGGGSIPFETARLGLPGLANDLNPVAALVMKATVEWPTNWPAGIGILFQGLARRWRRELEARLSDLFAQRDLPEQVDLTYLWSRTVSCPYCDGLVPLSPNWRLAPGGTGVRLRPEVAGGPGTAGRVCSFEIVESADEQSAGTVARDDGTCTFSD